MTDPALTVRGRSGDVRAVALVLPGGKADSFDPTKARQLAGVRMRPFAGSLLRAGGAHGLAVWSLRYRYRGWNGAQMSPVADARWALGEVRRRCGDVPVVLVGHSMGGRTAMRIATDDAVVGVVALAPWLPADEPVGGISGRVLIAHGSLDPVTSPRASQRYADRLRRAGTQVDFVCVRRETHAMILRPSLWHSLSTAYVLDVLGVRALGPRWQRVLERGVI